MPQAPYAIPPSPTTVLPFASGTGNQAVAPVCPISASERPPGMPGTMLPSISRAMDLPSAIAAVNQIQQLIQFIFYPPVPSTPIRPGTGTPAIAGNNSAGQGSINVNWSESDRNVETVAVHNPDDDTQYVMVDRITFLQFRSTSGNYWVWALQT